MNAFVRDTPRTTDTVSARVAKSTPRERPAAVGELLLTF